jgi:hypothetical protein
MLVRFAVLIDAWVVGRAPGACMSTYQGEIITGHFTRPYLFLVEDPFDATDNPARSVGTLVRPSAAVADISGAFKDAVNATMSLRSKQCVTALVKELFGSFAASSVDYQGMDMELDDAFVRRLATGDNRGPRSSESAPHVRREQGGKHKGASAEQPRGQKGGRRRSERRQQLLAMVGDEIEGVADSRSGRKGRQSMDLRDAIQELKAEMSSLARVAGTDERDPLGGEGAGSHAADRSSGIRKSRGGSTSTSKRPRCDACRLRCDGLAQALYGGVQLAGHGAPSCGHSDSERVLVGPGAQLRLHRRPWLTRRAACGAAGGRSAACELALHATAALSQLGGAACIASFDHRVHGHLRSAELFCGWDCSGKVSHHISLKGGGVPMDWASASLAGGESGESRMLKSGYIEARKQAVVWRGALPHPKRFARGSGCRALLACL